MPTLDPSHASRIAAAIDAVNLASASGLSPVADAMVVLDAVAGLQADLRAVLESERRRTLMTVA